MFAVFSSNGKDVDLHFGIADSALLYTIKEGNLKYLGEIYFQKYSIQMEHKFDEKRFYTIYDKLKKCDTIYVNKIGEKPKDKFQQSGIKVVEDIKTINEIIEEVLL